MRGAKGWQRRFDDPITLPDGRQLRTLRDAASYIMKLPKAKHDEPHWQLAGQLLLQVAEGRGILMMARMGMLRAINHGKPKPEKEPRRKRVKAYKTLR